jgi:phospholipase C
MAVALAACTTPGARELAEPKATLSGEVSGGPDGTYLVPAGSHKIRHVIVVMQENRSFDSYFGTFPGADGIPMSHGVPAVCAAAAS